MRSDSNNQRTKNSVRLALIFIYCSAVVSIVNIASTACGQSTVDAVEKWTTLAKSERPSFAEQTFAKQILTKSDAAKISQLLWEDHVKNLRRERQEEWDNKVIRLDDLKMKFEYRIFGDKPKNGRRLFISMHGGGGTRAEVNDSQWRNQIKLYQPEEGIYLAPRAPNDAWNMWHQAHIDHFFRRIIQNAVVFEDVNPDRVYIMGYSAGGDGVYQLAPRMADSLAAAAMMAGHPNDASPLALRNIGFTLHMGERDSAYQRNQKASDWQEKLTALQTADPDGYKHNVTIHKRLGHWMQRKDAVAVPWMSKFERDVNPRKIVWHQSGVKRDNFYWLSGDSGTGRTIKASRNGQVFNVELPAETKSLSLLLNDQIANLDEKIEVLVNAEPLAAKNVERNSASIFQSIVRFSDPRRIYSATLSVPIPNRHPN